MDRKFKETAEPVAVGGVVLVVDENYQEHFGLVTAVHGAFGGSYIPCINVIYVTGDEAKRDPYGQQTERMSSLQHHSVVTFMPKPGRFWANPA
jgi:hypothetical protein